MGKNFHDYCFLTSIFESRGMILLSKNLKVVERFLVLLSTDSGDAKSIIDVILVELTKTGLTSSKILSQVYDGASVMAGHCVGVQHLLQERENKVSLCALPKPSIAPCSGALN